MKRLQLFLMAILMLLGSTASRAAEMYAVLSGSTLTFYYDDSKASRTGSKYSMNSGASAPGWAQKTTITSVVFNSSFSSARPTTCYAWFYGLAGLKTITGINYLNTSSVTNMYGMFNNCGNLTSLDVSGFNTANVTTMAFMFNKCGNLKTLDVSGFNTAKVSTLECMFQDCSSLTSFDISSFTLKSSQNTSYMLNHLSALKSLTIPSTANVINANACGGIGTQSAPCALNFPSGFTPSKTYTGSGWYMWKNGYFKDGTTPTPSTTEAYAVLSGSTLTFYYDKNKASRSGTKYSLNTGTNNPGWSGSAASITKVVFNSNFEDARPETCYRWFNGMSKLTSIIGIEYLNTEDVTNMTSMFNGCSVLTSLDVSNFDTSGVKDMSYMFNGCSKLNFINFALSVSVAPNGYPSYYSGFVTTAATNLRNMFSGCSSLASLQLPEFEITSSKNSTEMFKGCSALQLLHIQGNYSGINASAFSGVGTTSKPCELEFEYATIDGVTTRTPTYFQWKAGYFKDYRTAFAVYMEDSQTLTFYYDVYEGSFMSVMHDYNLNEGSSAPGWLEFASKVKTVRFSEGFKDARPTSCYQWLYNVSNITKIEGLENLNTEYATNMASMFNGCKKLTSLDLSKFTFTSSSNTKLLANGCSALTTLTVPSTAGYLAADACKGVGTASAPITLNYPSGFTPEKTSTGNGYFVWKSGYFKSNSTIISDEEKPYAVLDGSTLTFYYDDSYNTRSGTVYDLNTGSDAPEWNSKATSVTKVVFNSSFDNAEPESCYRWFYNMNKLTNITGIGYLHTGIVDNMESMFNGCSSLTSIDVSGFDVSSVTTFAYMFNNCAKVTGGFDTEEWENSVATDMSYMFAGCTNLYGVSFASEGGSVGGMPNYFSNLSTANVTKMDGMFSGCSGLKNLNLVGFNLSKKPSTTNFLNGCSSLEWMHIPANMGNLNASACAGVGTASNPCYLEFEGVSLDGVTKRTPTYFVWKGGYFKDFRYPGVSYDETTYTLSFWFSDYSGPPMPEIHNYNLNEGSTTPDWLEFASQVKKVEFGKSFKDVCPTSCYQWFYNMTNLTAIEGLENLNTEYATNMASMFNGCKKLTSLDLSKFTFTSSSNTKLLANGCSALTTLTVPSTAGYLAADACKGVGTASAPITLNYPSGFTPEKTSTGNGYFVWKSGYFKETGTNPPTPPTNGEMYAVLNNNTLTFYYDESKASRTGTKYSMNSGASAPGWAQKTTITSVVFNSSFSSARPTTCYAWFYGLTGLKTITGINYLNTSSVTNMYGMFNDCGNLTSLDVSGFNTANVTTMAFMFNKCSGVKTLDVSKFNTAKVTDLEGMFQNCTGVTSLDISSFTLKSSQNTLWMINKCSGLKTLTIPSTANVLDGQACSGIGTQSAPCTLIHASGFTPDKTYTGNGWYLWKNGYFKSVTRYLGDVNVDGNIDVTDVMCIVDYVLGKPLKVFSAINAEMNSDGSIDITDAMMIVDIILHKSSSVAAATSISNCDMVYVTGRGGDLDLHLKGNNAYKAAEMTLVLPEGCSLYEAEMNPIRTDGHDVIINSLGNGTYRIVVLSVTGREFCPNGTALIHLTIDGDHHDNVVVSDVVMTSSDLESVSINCVPGIATGISGINSDDTDGEWYNIQGQRVATPQHGIYIRNGRKYSVK